MQTEVARAIEATVLPQYNKEMADARQVISRKGVTLRQEYLLITVACARTSRHRRNVSMRRVLRSMILIS